MMLMSSQDLQPEQATKPAMLKTRSFETILLIKPPRLPALTAASTVTCACGRPFGPALNTCTTALFLSDILLSSLSSLRARVAETFQIWLFRAAIRLVSGARQTFQSRLFPYCFRF